MVLHFAHAQGIQKWPAELLWPCFTTTASPLTTVPALRAPHLGASLSKMLTMVGSCFDIESCVDLVGEI